MFPHTITIFNIVDGKYYKQIVNDVLFVSEKIIAHEGMGEKYSNVHRTIFSSHSLENYVKKNDYKIDDDKYTLKVNDIIVKGKVDKIESIKDLQKLNYDYFLIKTISDWSDDSFGDIRNIEVTD